MNLFVKEMYSIEILMLLFSNKLFRLSASRVGSFGVVEVLLGAFIHGFSHSSRSISLVYVGIACKLLAVHFLHFLIRSVALTAWSKISVRVMSGQLFPSPTSRVIDNLSLLTRVQNKLLRRSWVENHLARRD